MLVNGSDASGNGTMGLGANFSLSGMSAVYNNVQLGDMSQFSSLLNNATNATASNANVANTTNANATTGAGTTPIDTTSNTTRRRRLSEMEEENDKRYLQSTKDPLILPELCLPLQGLSSEVDALTQNNMVGLSELTKNMTNHCVRNLCDKTEYNSTGLAFGKDGSFEVQKISCWLTPAALDPIIATVYIYDLDLNRWMPSIYQMHDKLKFELPALKEIKLNPKPLLSPVEEL